MGNYCCSQSPEARSLNWLYERAVVCGSRSCYGSTAVLGIVMEWKWWATATAAPNIWYASQLPDVLYIDMTRIRSDIFRLNSMWTFDTVIVVLLCDLCPIVEKKCYAWVGKRNAKIQKKKIIKNSTEYVSWLKTKHFSTAITTSSVWWNDWKNWFSKIRCCKNSILS